jgi:hypothetical protein
VAAIFWFRSLNFLALRIAITSALSASALLSLLLSWSTSSSASFSAVLVVLVLVAASRQSRIPAKRALGFWPLESAAAHRCCCLGRHPSRFQRSSMPILDDNDDADDDACLVLVRPRQDAS